MSPKLHPMTVGRFQENFHIIACQCRPASSRGKESMRSTRYAHADLPIDMPARHRCSQHLLKFSYSLTTHFEHSLQEMLVSFFFLVLSLTAISNAQAGNEGTS